MIHDDGSLCEPNFILQTNHTKSSVKWKSHFVEHMTKRKPSLEIFILSFDFNIFFFKIIFLICRGIFYVFYSPHIEHYFSAFIDEKKRYNGGLTHLHLFCSATKHRRSYTIQVSQTIFRIEFKRQNIRLIPMTLCTCVFVFVFVCVWYSRPLGNESKQNSLTASLCAHKNTNLIHEDTESERCNTRLRSNLNVWEKLPASECIYLSSWEWAFRSKHQHSIRFLCFLFRCFAIFFFFVIMKLKRRFYYNLSSIFYICHTNAFIIRAMRYFSSRISFCV